jgi:hypothetical protein
MFSLQRQREGGLYFGGIADHSRACRWLNPLETQLYV